MDLSLLLHPSPLSPSLRLFPPPTTRRHFNSRRRHVTLRLRSHVIASSSSSVETLTYTNPTAIFGPERKLTGVQQVIDGMSPTVRIASSLAVATVAVMSGYGIGLKVSGTTKAAAAGAAVLGVAGGAMVYKINSEVPEVAAISLHNLVVGHDDPLELKREEVEGVAKRFEFSSCTGIPLIPEEKSVTFVL